MGYRRRKGAGSKFEKIMAEKFSNLGKETDIQVQEEQRVPNEMNPQKPTPRHTVN